MDYQITKITQDSINLNKNIGKVIYIVEGEKREFTLLKHLFTKMLNEHSPSAS